MYGESDGPVLVAAGIIKIGTNVLICQRAINHRYGLKWEFPGGKTYPGEDLSECLLRELDEELGIVPTTYREIKTLQSTYPDGGHFQVSFYLITAYEGEVRNKVFENIAWVPVDELKQYDLLEGSLPILQYLPVDR